VPSLVILAAGRGTRFGGSKQTSAVGPSGEWLVDYALFDGWRAGFSSAVLVVRPGAEREFDSLRARAGRHVDVRVAPQRTGLLPADIEGAPRRVPWGTAHAVLAARSAIDDGPFAVVNADDFYGEDAYRRAAAALEYARTDGVATIVARRLADTLSIHGPVTRAICQGESGRVVRLEEVRGLERRGVRIVSADGAPVSPDALVSMNCWVLPDRAMDLLAGGLARFTARPDFESCEFLLPAAIADCVTEGTLTVRVDEASGPWFGLTHAADRSRVEAELGDLTNRGLYPSPLW